MCGAVPRFAVTKLDPVIGDGTAVTLLPLPGVSASFLQKKVLQESKKMYVTSGVQGDAGATGGAAGSHHHRVAGAEDKSNLARLARELSALSLAGNSAFTMLNESRYTGLRSITRQFEAEMRKIRATAGSGPVAAASTEAAAPKPESPAALMVACIVGLVENLAQASPDACLPMIRQVRNTICTIPAFRVIPHPVAPTRVQVSGLLRSFPIGALSTAADDTGVWLERLSTSLCALAASSPDAVSTAVREAAAEACMLLSLARGSLRDVMRSSVVLLKRLPSAQFDVRIAVPACTRLRLSLHSPPLCHMSCCCSCSWRRP